MNRREKQTFSSLLAGGILFTAIFGLWWFEPSHISHNFHGGWHILDFILFFILSYIVWHHIVMELFAWYMSARIPKSSFAPTPPEGLRVAYVTAYVPGAEPPEILEKTLAAMVAVDYPHDTWLLDEGNDPLAKEICSRHGVHHYSRKGKEYFNTDTGKYAKKTKGGNYNSWLYYYEDNYDILAQHDVDFIPKRNFLTRTLGYFKDPQVAFVGTPQVYGNLEESWIARGAAEQTFGFYGPLQRGFHGDDMTLLIGANHIMRIAAYKAIDGYTAHITEDMLTGMKLYAHADKWKSVYIPEVLLIGEGPATWSSYFSQQLRWAYGCMDIVFRHAPSLLPKMNFRRIFNYTLLQQFYFSGVAQVLGVALLTLYFIFGITAARMTLLPILVLYIPLLVYQIFFQLWLQRFNIDPKTERGLLLRGKLLALAAWPVYFIAFIGVIANKRLKYVVTPKGPTTEFERNISLFIPHLILGSITFFDIILGFVLGHDAIQILFWALLNTVFMFYFFFAEALPVGFKAVVDMVPRRKLLLKPEAVPHYAAKQS